jgi:uncharacterized membrane protein YraQ (UPF0718 family)
MNPSQSTKPKRKLIDWAFVVVAGLSLVAAVHVFLRDGWTVWRGILIEDLELFVLILPKVAAGCLIGALVRLMVPRELVVKWVGEGSGLLGLVIAALVGMVFPGGPFTIFPLAGAFMLIGADKGAAVAFVTGWLLLGVNRIIIWEMPFFGPDFVILRALVSLPLPVLAGVLGRAVDRLLPKGQGDA